MSANGSGRTYPLLSGLLILVTIGLAGPPSQAAIEGDTWLPIGPAPIDGFFAGGVSGRASAIAVNPENHDDVWIGTAAGGVWHSLDAGVNWEPMSDREAALSVGAIALQGCDSEGCSTIYAGTGENAIRRDTYHGGGLLVGAVSGDVEFPVFSWVLRKGDPFDFTHGSINDVVVDPTTIGAATRIFVTLSSGVTVSATEATLTAPDPGGGFGLYQSNDQGVSWSKLAVNGQTGAKPSDLEMAPDNANVLYAGFLGRGVFKSTDKGATWCPLNEGIQVPAGCPNATGLPNVSSNFDHVEIAIWPGDSDVVYAAFGFCPDRLLQNCVRAIYRTMDGGATWTERFTGNPSHDGGLGSAAAPRGYSRYTQALAVHPDNQNVLILGGIRLWRSTDGGQSFSAADTNLAPFMPGTEPGVLHYDHREVVFHPTSTNRAYSTSDGGFAHSTDGGASWRPGNDDLQITGFHSIGASPLVGTVIGGSQDNGGQVWNGSRRWTHAQCCGDAGFAFRDFDIPQRMYAASNHADLRRSDGGLTWSSWSSINSGIPDTEPRLFYAPFVQNPGGSHPLFFGGSRLFRSLNDGNNWEAISPVLATGNQPEIVTAGSTSAHIAAGTGTNVITAIGLSPSEQDRIYIGYYGGEIFTTDSPCATPACWQRIDVDGMPDDPVTRIAVHPSNPRVAYGTFSGFGRSARVWRTANAGSSWQPKANGLPRGVPANTISIEPSSPNRLWLGLDSGPEGSSLYKSIDSGNSWQPFSKGLPNAPVYEIAIDETHNRVYAATHGRGAFVLGRPFISTLEGWVKDSIWDVPVYGQNFLPNQSCTMQLLQTTGDVCAQGSVDAMGGAIKTDGGGVLITDRATFYEGHPVAWGCFNGACLDGTPIEQCNDDQDGDGDRDPLSTVIVACGGQSATTRVLGCPALSNPPSSLLGLDLEGLEGDGGGGEGPADGVARTDGAAPRSFQLSASVQARDGTRSLCTVTVPFTLEDDKLEVLERAQAALDESPTCAAAGVTAVLDRGEAGESEDEFPRDPGLSIATTGVVGGQVLTAVHAEPGRTTGACFALSGLGIPVLNQIHIMRLGIRTLEGGALGGAITVQENSPLGPCEMTVPTEAGQSAPEIASAIEQAFQAPGIPGGNPNCPARYNPRDVVADGESVISVFATAIKVCPRDPGVGFTLRSEELENVHPDADAGPDRTVPPDRPIELDGSNSSDPDSSVGTNDDIIRFEWFEIDAAGNSILLATEETTSVTFAPGTHVVRLRVTDKGRLSDTDEAVITVAQRVERFDPRVLVLLRSLEELLKGQQRLLDDLGMTVRELIGSYRLSDEEARQLVLGYSEMIGRQGHLVQAFQEMVREIREEQAKERK
jgi:photosystem II stability/assembly factor-like uncharacterized protein